MKLGGVFVEHLGKLALRLGHNLMFFAALWLAGAVLGLVLPWFLPVICATLGWLALSAYFFTKYEPWFDGWALLLGAVPIVMTAMSAADYVYVSLGTPQPVKSLAQAAQSAPVRVYQLPADLHVRSELSHRYVAVHKSKSGGTTRTTYVVAPLVDSDWQPGDPVSAFVTCTAGHRYGCPKAPHDAPLGVRPSLFRRSGFATAAERACQQHALRCEKEPLILDLRPTLEAAVSDSRRAVFLSPVIGFVGWAIPRLLLDLYRLLAALLTTLRTAWFHDARPTKT